MKTLSNKGLAIRLRRTVTNKFSTIIRPRYRKRLRELAFKDKDFCRAVDKAAEVLTTLSEQVEKEYAEKQQEMQEAIKAKKEQK